MFQGCRDRIRLRFREWRRWYEKRYDWIRQFRKTYVIIGLLIGLVMGVFLGHYGWKTSPASPAPVQQLKIEVSAPVAVALPSAPSTPVCKDWNYEVLKGDYINSLWRVSANQVVGFGHRWPIIAKANGITEEPFWIYPGQVLTIPCSLYDLSIPAPQMQKLSSETSTKEQTEAELLPESVPTTKAVVSAEKPEMAVSVEQPTSAQNVAEMPRVEDSPLPVQATGEKEDTPSTQTEPMKVALDVPIDATVIRSRNSVRVMKPGLYEITVESSAVTGLSPGIFPTLVIISVADNGGKYESEKTVTSVRKTADNGFELGILLNKPFPVSNFSSVVFDLGGENAPVMIGSELLAQGNLIANPKKMRGFDNKRYSNLLSIFPKRPSLKSRIFQSVLTFGIPSTLGFMAIGPPGAVIPVVNHIIQTKFEKAQRAAALVALSAIEGR
ncbi:MAG: hypothetical protein V1685_05000 [Parcubacteria group bacterium]